MSTDTPIRIILPSVHESPCAIAQQYAPVQQNSTQTNTNILTNPALSSLTMPRKPKKNIEGRVASRDLRIGLNLLGENGRMLLAEYIKTKTIKPAC